MRRLPLALLGASLCLAPLVGCNGSTISGTATFPALLDGVKAGRADPMDRTRTADTRKGGKRRLRSGALTSVARRKGSARLVHNGSGSFVSARAPKAIEVKAKDGDGGYALSLNEAPIAAAANAVLGEALNVAYAVDPSVGGTVTLQTAGHVPRTDLLEVFETALAVSGAAIVRQGDTYRIVPQDKALSVTPSVSIPRVGPRGPGTKVHVIELTAISAAEMRTILEPMVRTGAILRADQTKNYIMVAGNDAELAAIRDAVSLFDVDAFRGQSVGMFPLQSSAPGEVAKELESVFRSAGIGENLVRFLPNRRLNAVLVVTARPRYLRRAEKLIE